MNRQRKTGARLPYAKWLVCIMALALMMSSLGAAPAQGWGNRFFYLAGECYHFSVPTSWGAIQGSGDNRILIAFSEGSASGALLMTATRLEAMKASLEAAGISVADWLIEGIVAGDDAVMFTVAQLAKVAGLRAAAVESVGERKVLVFEAAGDSALAATAVCIQGEYVIMAQVSLEGASNASRQRALVMRIMESFGVQATTALAFGNQRIRVPEEWEFTGTSGNAAVSWRVDRADDRMNAVACVVPLGETDSVVPVSGADAMSVIMRGMLEKMLVKVREAGLTADDGLVRLYDCSEPDFPLWVALFVNGADALVCGVWSGGARGGDYGRETVEQLVRGMEAMQGSGRAMAMVAEE